MFAMKIQAARTKLALLRCNAVSGAAVCPDSWLLMQPVRRQDNFSSVGGEANLLHSVLVRLRNVCAAGGSGYSGSSPSATYRLVDSTSDHEANSRSLMLPYNCRLSESGWSSWKALWCRSISCERDDMEREGVVPARVAGR